MAECRETSVLFSLKSLLDIEEERVRGEEAVRQERESAEAAAREAAAAAARDAERARIAASERVAALQRVAAEDERQRRDALRLAAIERARVEGEAAARLAVVERERAHEERLRTLEHEGGRRRWRWVLVGSNVTWAVLFTVGCGGYLAVVRPTAAREQRSLAALARAEAERAETSAGLARQAEARATSLRARLAEAERSLAAARPGPSPVVAPPAPHLPTSGGPEPAGADPVSPRCRRDSGDPLDFALCR